MPKPTRALVIDDSRVVRHAVRTHIGDLVDVVVEAADGVEGLVSAERHAPDIVLCDVDMPVLDGIGFLHRFRAHRELATTPVLLVSGEADVETKVRGFGAGASDYLVKPFAPAELRARVANYLRLKTLQDELVRLATTDMLTGLYNRRAFMQRLEAALAKGGPLSVLLGDVDHFKRVNDTLGHAAGDAVLVRIAETLLAAARREDTVARFGGEEFVVLLPGAKLDEAADIAERLRGAVASNARATMSIGAAAFDARCTETIDAVLARADAAVYRAKAAGRNRVECEEGAHPLRLAA